MSKKTSSNMPRISKYYNESQLIMADQATKIEQLTKDLQSTRTLCDQLRKQAADQINETNATKKRCTEMAQEIIVLNRQCETWRSANYALDNKLKSREMRLERYENIIDALARTINEG